MCLLICLLDIVVLLHFHFSISKSVHSIVSLKTSHSPIFFPFSKLTSLPLSKLSLQIVRVSFLCFFSPHTKVLIFKPNQSRLLNSPLNPFISSYLHECHLLGPNLHHPSRSLWKILSTLIWTSSRFAYFNSFSMLPRQMMSCPYWTHLKYYQSLTQ